MFTGATVSNAMLMILSSLLMSTLIPKYKAAGTVPLVRFILMKKIMLKLKKHLMLNRILNLQLIFSYLYLLLLFFRQNEQISKVRDDGRVGLFRFHQQAVLTLFSDLQPDYPEGKKLYFPLLFLKIFLKSFSKKFF